MTQPQQKTRSLTKRINQRVSACQIWSRIRNTDLIIYGGHSIFNHQVSISVMIRKGAKARANGTIKQEGVEVLSVQGLYQKPIRYQFREGEDLVISFDPKSRELHLQSEKREGKNKED